MKHKFYETRNTFKIGVYSFGIIRNALLINSIKKEGIKLNRNKMLI